MKTTMRAVVWPVVLTLCLPLIVVAEFDSGFALSFDGFAFLGKFCFVRQHDPRVIQSTRGFFWVSF